MELLEDSGDVPGYKYRNRFESLYPSSSFSTGIGQG
jgi:hypothetical protein